VPTCRLPTYALVVLPVFAELLRRGRPWIVLLAAGLVLGAALLGGAASDASVDAATPTTFSLTARQAEEVRVVTEFVEAFNERRLATALALFTSSREYVRFVSASDCDYRRVVAVGFLGRSGVRTWLRRRFADRDHLTLETVYDENPEQPLGVVLLTYSRRTSRTLAALGFPRGIRPQLATKVGFTPRGPVRMTTFANGPLGGSDPHPRECRPVQAGP
jgi:hypothetical protein